MVSWIFDALSAAAAVTSTDLNGMDVWQKKIPRRRRRSTSSLHSFDRFFLFE